MIAAELTREDIASDVLDHNVRSVMCAGYTFRGACNALGVTQEQLCAAIRRVFALKRNSACGIRGRKSSST